MKEIIEGVSLYLEAQFIQTKQDSRGRTLDAVTVTNKVTVLRGKGDTMPTDGIFIEVGELLFLELCEDLTLALSAKIRPPGDVLALTEFVRAIFPLEKEVEAGVLRESQWEGISKPGLRSADGVQVEQAQFPVLFFIQLGLWA
jgi:hypothetical protein